MRTHALPTTKCTGLYRARARPCRGPWRTTSGLSTARLPHCQHELATAVRAHRSGHARRARKSGLPTRSTRAVGAHARRCMRPGTRAERQALDAPAQSTRASRRAARPATRPNSARQAVQESYQARGEVHGLACYLGVRLRARVCTCRPEAHHAKTCARSDAPSTRPHQDVKISPCRSRSQLSPGRLQKPMPTSTAEPLRDHARPSTRPCTRLRQSPSGSAKTTRDALHLRQSGDGGE